MKSTGKTHIGGFFYFSYFSSVWKVGFFYQMSFFLVETFGIKIDQNTCNSPNFDQIQRCKDSKPKKRKKIKKMADKERTATAAFLPRGLGKGGAKGRHSSAQSQVGCNPENPGFFPSLELAGRSSKQPAPLPTPILLWVITSAPKSRY